MKRSSLPSLSWVAAHGSPEMRARAAAALAGLDGRVAAASPHEAEEMRKLAPKVVGPAKRRGVMNGTETRYAQALEARRLSGEIYRWDYEPCALWLAGNPSVPVLGRMVYTPDFRVIYPDGAIEFVEVKGVFVRRDGRTRWKAAAEAYSRNYRWRWAQWKGGKWHEETYGC